MRMTPERAQAVGFQELSARQRLAALFDPACFTELVGPFDRIGSPWLVQQGLVPQSDDGTVVARGIVGGKEVVGIAIEGAFEGGSIGEVGGAKIAEALELAAESCRAGRPIGALLSLETGGVRLQEATLGLASIARIQSAIVELRRLTPVVVVIAGPVGCFGGMSLAAALCTHIIGTPYGRLGMNGPEVIEQEAGPDEMDARNREAIWQLIGCEARYRAGWIDELVGDDLDSLVASIRNAFAKDPHTPQRGRNAAERLRKLQEDYPRKDATSPAALGRGRLWIETLSGGQVETAYGVASILTADVVLPGEDQNAFALCISTDAASRLPRASSGELGLEQAWALAARIDEFIAEEKDARIRRPLLAIVDSPGQAYGRVEEQRCISVAAAAAIDAYARARQAGHPVLTLVVGRAVSGSFLAHGLQSDHIFALAGDEVSMYAMSAASMARITRRSLTEIHTAAAATLPLSFAIEDAYRLGIIDTLIRDVQPDGPTAGNITTVKSAFRAVLVKDASSLGKTRSIMDNPFRKATEAVRHAMTKQWALADSSAWLNHGPDLESVKET